MRHTISVLLIIIGLFLVSFGSLGLYQDFNSSNIYGYGRGWLEVSACKPVHDYYECTGNFRQYGGMIEAENMTIRTSRSYPSGATIDSYLHYDQADENNLNNSNSKLQTDSQRRGLAYNAWYLTACVVGTATILYAILRLIRRIIRSDRM